MSRVSNKNISNFETSDEERRNNKADSTTYRMGLTGQQMMMAAASRSDDKLQYLDLDHSVAPSGSSHNLAVSKVAQQLEAPSIVSSAVSAAGRQPSGSGKGIVYKTVDFVKTEAFKRTRQDAEIRFGDPN